MTPPVDPKVVGEMRQHVGPTLLALSRAIRKMHAKKVPLDEELYRRASWARAALQDLSNALSRAEAMQGPPGLFDVAGDA